MADNCSEHFYRVTGVIEGDNYDIFSWKCIYCGNEMTERINYSEDWTDVDHGPKLAPPSRFGT